MRLFNCEIVACSLIFTFANGWKGRGVLRKMDLNLEKRTDGSGKRMSKSTKFAEQERE
jgi:hypothetical protein